MRTSAPLARNPSTGDSLKTVIPPFAQTLLDRLTRLRVCTASQAHLLTPALAKYSKRNAYTRLGTLVRHAWLVTDAVAPSRGAATKQYYRPSHKALKVLGLEKKVGLLQRPAQHVLEWLLFRGDVYAQATAAGWWIGSPTFLAPDKHEAALNRFNAFIKARALARYTAAQASRAPAAQLLELRTQLDRLPTFLPKQLDFEFIFRVDAATKHTSEVVLLVIDDVRRSIETQVATLPLTARADCGVLIRDCDSVWDTDAGALCVTGARLTDLRRAVAARLSPEFVARDTHLPTVWARFTRPLPEATASKPKEQTP